MLGAILDRGSFVAVRPERKRTTWWTCSSCGTTTGGKDIEATEEAAKNHAALYGHVTRTSSGKVYGA